MTGPAIGDLERALLTAIPAARTGFDGPAVVRAGAGWGGSGRANSACWLGDDDGAALAARIGRIEGWYARLGLPAKVRVTPLAPPTLDGMLAQRGWGRAAETVAMVAALDPLPLPDGEAIMAEAPDEAWLAVRADAAGAHPARVAEKRAAPSLLLVPAVWVAVAAEGATASVAFAATVGDLAVLADVATSPRFRGRGLARRACLSALGWARAEGARWGALHVVADNDPALSLYRRLGFREAYRYHYREGG